MRFSRHHALQRQTRDVAARHVIGLARRVVILQRQPVLRARARRVLAELGVGDPVGPGPDLRVTASREIAIDVEHHIVDRQGSVARVARLGAVGGEVGQVDAGRSAAPAAG